MPLSVDHVQRADDGEHDLGEQHPALALVNVIGGCSLVQGSSAAAPARRTSLVSLVRTVGSRATVGALRRSRHWAIWVTRRDLWFDVCDRIGCGVCRWRAGAFSVIVAATAVAGCRGRAHRARSAPADRRGGLLLGAARRLRRSSCRSASSCPPWPTRAGTLFFLAYSNCALIGLAAEPRRWWSVGVLAGDRADLGGVLLLLIALHLLLHRLGVGHHGDRTYPDPPGPAANSIPGLRPAAAGACWRTVLNIRERFMTYSVTG